ncbi:MAG: hydrogenase maturation protease [Thioalkalispiraceae bacterium]
MIPIKVIGIGSPFGQDQLGWLVIERLNSTLPETKAQQVQLRASDRPGIQLLQELKDCAAAILIDAIDDKARAGQVVQLDKTALIAQGNTLSSHAMGVSETLSLGQALGELPQQLYLAGLCVDTDKPGLPDRQAVQQLADMVITILDWLTRPTTTEKARHA